MSLTQNQFEVLTLIERKQDEKLTQRTIAKKCQLSLGMTNKILAELKELELIRTLDDSRYRVTPKAYEWLEPYKVKKAIFIAAGVGSRMMPVTLHTPKPLVKVRGKRMIETILDAVIDVGITDITIVRGYLGNQFDILLEKYPTIKFVENPIYNESNNISSIYVVRDLLANAYVFESDLVIYNKEIIRKYEYMTNYIGVPVERTDDWCFKTKKGDITKIKVGGEKVHHMFGISYWTPEDAKKLEQDIEKVYRSPGGKERYWDEVALRECVKDYKVAVREVTMEDLVELDTYKELKAVDPQYNLSLQTM